jgi:hypothetical protein
MRYEVVKCIITKIIYAQQLEDVCDWDDRLKCVKWVEYDADVKTLKG